MFFFFFSSRRRHTRWPRDWSSDVCSSDLLLHVLFDEMHRDVARPLVHDLAAVLPGDLRQLALRLQLGELRLVVGVGDRSRTQAVAEAEGDVVCGHELADLAEARVEKILLVMREAPLR